MAFAFCSSAVLGGQEMACDGKRKHNNNINIRLVFAGQEANDGFRVWVKKAESTLGNQYIGNEHGGGRDRKSW